MKKLSCFILSVIISVVYMLLAQISNYFMLIAFDEKDVFYWKGMVYSLIFFAAAILIVLITNKKTVNKKKVVFNIICLVISTAFFALWFYLCTPMMDWDRMAADKMDACLAGLLILMNLSYVVLNAVLLTKSLKRLKSKTE